jgi:hypothetical protein
MPTANTPALILLRIGAALAAVLAALLVLLHAGNRLPLGNAAIYAVTLGGGAVIASGLRRLFRDLDAPAQAPGKPH